MVSCKLIFAFIFAITLAINVVPSSASGRRKPSSQSSSPLSPHGIPPVSSPHGTEPPSPIGSAPPSPLGPVPPARSGTVPQSPYGSEAPSPRGSEPPSPRGPVLPSLRGAVRESPYGSELPSPRGSAPQSPHGSEPPSPHGSGLSSPHGTPPASPFGTEPSSPQGSAPPSPTRVKESLPVRVPNREKGEYNFGDSVPGERLIGVPMHIHKPQPELTYASYGGVHTYEMLIRTPNKERVTRFEIDSLLGYQSGIEHVNFDGFNETHDGVYIRIWSKRYTDINYIIRLYGF